jgi:hypothetical protein
MSSNRAPPCKLTTCEIEERGQWTSAVKQAYEATRQSIKREYAKGGSGLGAEDEVASHVRLLQTITQQFIVLMGSDGQLNPMDWMLDTAASGAALSIMQTGRG